jgi:hypothetical protein
MTTTATGSRGFASISDCTFSPDVISSYVVRDSSNIDISFNSSVYSNPTVPPNITGITYWFGSPFSAAGLSPNLFIGWRTQMIYPVISGTAGSAFPVVTMNWNGSGTPAHWYLSIFYQAFSSAPFSGITNISGAGYGYILYITALS